MENDGQKIVHTDTSMPFRRVLSASTIVKDNVYNRLNEEIGAVKEIMIDVPSGRIAYAVLAVGGFLGMGERLFAIPWGAMALDEDRKCFIMDAGKDRLKNAPGFDKNNWPDMADATWGSHVNEYWRDPIAASGVSAHSDEIGLQAGRRYDREAAGRSDREVEQEAQEARRAIDSSEGPSLRAAEEVGKSRARD